MKTLIEIIKNETLGFSIRMESVLILHMNTVDDDFSKILWELDFHEGGKVSTDSFRNEITISGDNGIEKMSQNEFLTLIESTVNNI